jgi:AcrR family transcriptional regulator
MRNGEATRREIERSALELFVEKGVSETSIKDISKRAHIADGTMYRHYESKNSLAEQIFVSAYKHMTNKIALEVEKRETIEEKLDYIIEYFCLKFDGNKLLLSFLLKMQHAQAKHIQANPNSVYNVLTREFSQHLPEDNYYKLHPEMGAAIFIGIVLQAGIDRVYGRTDRSMMEDYDSLKQATFHALNLK